MSNLFGRAAIFFARAGSREVFFIVTTARRNREGWFVDDGNDLISAGDGEAAAGEEVVLDVDEEEGFHEW